jgi:hypothetical protein
LEGITMKRFILAALAAFSLIGCANTTTQPSTIDPLAQAMQPQQIVAQACVLLPGILSILQVQEPAFPASVAADITRAQQIISGATINGVAVPGICTAGAVINAASVQTLANTVMPIIVNAVELSPAVTPQVKAEVAAAQGIFLLVQAQQAAKAGGAATAPSTPTCGADGSLCKATTAPATIPAQ